jgi:hypothetical protein
LADFRIGDTKITLGYGTNVLNRGIRYYQKDMLDHPAPANRSNHWEVVVEVTVTTVKTFSQTAPVAKWVTYDKARLNDALQGDKPRFALFRFHDYSNVVTAPFQKGMLHYFTKKVSASRQRGWRRYWNYGTYDAGQLLMYPTNWILRRMNYRKHVAWLEKSGANVCSDAAVSGYRHGLRSAGKDPFWMFPGLPSSEVAPSHAWMPDSNMFRVR